MKKPDWKMRWRVLCRQTKHEGVYETKEGGYLIRARVKDPTRPGTLIPRLRVLPPGTTPEEAVEQRLRLKREARERAGVTPSAPPSRPVFHEYAASVFEWRVKQGQIASPATKRTWITTLQRLFEAPFASKYVDAITGADVKAWLKGVPIGTGPDDYSPRTINAWWLGTLKVIFKAAQTDLGLAVNPMAGIDRFDTSLYRTYTKEQPNALPAEAISDWLALVEAYYPQHHMLVKLGFETGRRPSALRPLRRKGPEADIDWKTGVLTFRRSHVRGTKGDAIMEKTKTSKDQDLHLPDNLLTALRAHVARLEEFPGPLRDSELLFPSPSGKPWSVNILRAVFRNISECYGLQADRERALALYQLGQVRVSAACRALGLTRTDLETQAAAADPRAAARPAPARITPRAMRRSVYALTDAAEIEDHEARQITDHASERMADRYREGQQLPRQAARQRLTLAKICDFVEARDRLRGGQTGGEMARRTEEVEAAPRRCDKL